MLFYSTSNKSLKVSLRQAVLKGLADDGGLFMPEVIPALPHDFFANISKLSPVEISFRVAEAFLSDDIPGAELNAIVSETISFPIPLVNVTDHIFSLELFHGPTLAFKDVGARFMARLLSYFRKEEQGDITVLVATSGDTGSAVANGFLGVKGIKVVILYPGGKVSEIQEKQLTTLGQNIISLEINGTFDDCQALVKRAFSDKELNETITLTSANSINIARLLPQTFYYFMGYSQLPKTNLPVVICVPSGNFGNLTAGLIAKKMGLPIGRFIAATNVNDVVPEYLSTGNYYPRPSLRTISNAMDVGNPSNFARMLDVYGNDWNAMRHDIAGFRFTDEETKQTMREVFEKYGYLLDPHGAVGFSALKKYLNQNKASGIFLETAHPAKFPDVVEPVINGKVEIPERLAACLSKQKQSIRMDNSYEALKEFLSNGGV
ncbi:MAG TPA: threonine synthase [Chitinophagales bacterium]|nr:threonine synthase [Chitinophagales bacterium]